MEYLRRYHTTIHYSTIVTFVIIEIKEHWLPCPLTFLHSGVPFISEEVWDDVALPIFFPEFHEKSDATIWTSIEVRWVFLNVGVLSLKR